MGNVELYRMRLCWLIKIEKEQIPDEGINDAGSLSQYRDGLCSYTRIDSNNVKLKSVLIIEKV